MEEDEPKGLNWDDLNSLDLDDTLLDFSKKKYDHIPQEDKFEEFFKKKKREETSKEVLFSGYSDKVPESISWEDLDNEVFPEQSWRINKLIPKEGFAIVASISGNRKTWFAMEMAKNIVSGENFLGREEFKTEGSNILYINGENGKSEMQRRGRQLGFKSKTPFKLYLVNEDNLNLNQDDADIWLKSFIEFNDIKVVFIDTFIAIAGGLKEDKAEDVRQFFNKFNSLKNSGVAVVWLMHLRKPSHFEGKTPKKEQLLGSQDKTASVEVLLMLHSESGSDEINVYQRKNRLSKEIDPFKILMKDSLYESNELRTTLEYGGLIEDSENKKDQAKEIILEVLEESEGKTTKEILEITNKQIGSKNTLQALRELVDDGSLKLEKKGKSNFYSLEKGSEETLETGGPHIKKDEIF